MFPLAMALVKSLVTDLPEGAYQRSGGAHLAITRRLTSYSMTMPSSSMDNPATISTPLEPQVD